MEGKFLYIGDCLVAIEDIQTIQAIGRDFEILLRNGIKVTLTMTNAEAATKYLDLIATALVKRVVPIGKKLAP